jgi:uncharacterized membrane protein HdeD (DUF308 family)
METRGTGHDPLDTLSERDRSTFWGGPVIMGILMMALGVFAMGSTRVTMVVGVVSIVTLGVLMAASGIVEIVYGLRAGREKGVWPLLLLAGLLSLAVGILFLLRPAAGLGALTFLLAGYFIASGLLRAVTSVVDRYHHWGWDFATGVISLLLGGIVIAQWPLSAMWLLGLLVGIEVFVRGLMLVAMGMEMRGYVRGTSPLVPAESRLKT